MSVEPSPSQKKESLIDKRLFYFLFHDLGYDVSEPPELLTSSYHWYSAYLTMKFIQSWELVSKVVVNIAGPPTVSLNSHDSAILTRILLVIFEVFEVPNFAIVDIVDRLYNEGLAKYTDENRSDANQFVFAVVGWLSKLSFSKTQAV